MPFQRFTYTFTVPLAALPPRAYRWATDYRSTDFQLSGMKATRKVERLTKDLVLLTDSFLVDPFDPRPGARTVKRKLVHLYPNRLSWTATHLSGPAKYSQFLYEITPRGRTESVLHFTGSQVEKVQRAPSPSAIARRKRELRREDSRLWAHLSSALARDLA